MAIEKRKKKITSRNIDDYIQAESHGTEIGAGDNSPVKDIQWDAKQTEAHSELTLEADQGDGRAVIVRNFDFKMNPETWREHQPTKQELLNSHLRQIEILLMKDGLKPFTETEPRVMISKNQQFYRIVVGAEPMKGWLLHDRPKTLSQLAHGK